MIELKEIFIGIIDPANEVNQGEIDVNYVQEYAFNALGLGCSQAEAQHLVAKIEQYFTKVNDGEIWSTSDYYHEFTAYFEDMFQCDSCNEIFFVDDVCDDRPDDFPAIRCSKCYEKDVLENVEE